MNVHLKPSRRLLRVAAYVGLVALAMMMWPLFDHHPFAIVIAMSFGQLLGTISFGLFLVIVVADLLKNRVLTDDPADASFNTIPPDRPKKDRTPSASAETKERSDG